jgi:hypothetical protein
MELSILYDSEFLPPGEKTWAGNMQTIGVGALAPNIIFPFPIAGSFSFRPRTVVVVFGEVTYQDVFTEKEHHTTFCDYTFDNNNSRFGACPVFNEMN